MFGRITVACFICVASSTGNKVDVGPRCLLPFCRLTYWKQNFSDCSARKLAIVTGANKGIGLAIVRGLCKQFDGDVLLTARSETRGLKAVVVLRNEGLNPIFHQLDVTNPDSILLLKNVIEEKYEGIDVLVNNAGVDVRTVGFKPRSAINMGTNFWGTLNVSQALFPFLKSHARVVNLGSISAKDVVRMCSTQLRERLADSVQDMATVKQLMQEFVQSVQEGTYREKGWPKAAYGVSKIGVILLSFVQQTELDQFGRDDVIVNACCPGDVATEMSGFQGDKTADEGADTPVYLSLLPPFTTGPRGQFVMDRKIYRFP